jgi:ArsR family transcriptional regulator
LTYPFRGGKYSNIHISERLGMDGSIERDFVRDAELLKVLGHPVRLKIVAGLQEKAECCVKDIWECLEMPQATVSQHLALLKHKGVVESYREGVNVRYRVIDKRVEGILRALKGPETSKER